MQLCLGLFGLIAFVIMLVAFPETSHPGARGIDKLRQSGFVGRRWFPVFVNPLKPLNLLRSPTIFSVVCGYFFRTLVLNVFLLDPDPSLPLIVTHKAVAGFFVLLTDYGIYSRISFVLFGGC